MQRDFEVRMYNDIEDDTGRITIVEISQISDIDTLTRIINFLERLRSFD